MFGTGHKVRALELLSFCVWLLSLSGIILGRENGPGVIKVVVKQGSDAVLPCLISNKENIIAKIFQWKKDFQKKVFMYDSGIHSNNGRLDQDEQFKGRVSHFQDQLMNGNASIKIQNTKVADSGTYSCDFPRLQPRQTFNIELVVGPGVIKVVVKQGSDAVLPCLISTKESIIAKIFQWKKDDQKEVFFYDSGIHFNNGRPGQDQPFFSRVSHFQDQLMNGNASIKINNTKVADSGNYSCDFPRLHPRQTFIIELVVEPILKDRSGEIPGASKPVITTLDETKDLSLLQCEVRRAFPKPKVEWQDSAGNILPAEEPQVSERGGHYYVTLNTTVTKTGRCRCVATQEDINHQTFAETKVFISEKPDITGWLFGGIVLGAVVQAVVVAVLVATKSITVTCNRGYGVCKKPPDDDLKKPHPHPPNDAEIAMLSDWELKESFKRRH